MFGSAKDFSARSVQGNNQTMPSSFSGESGVSWSTWRQAVRVMLHPPFLRKTLSMAFGVGFVLFLINHSDAVFAGRATSSTYLKGLFTCIVPFSVANWGVLVGTRR